MAVITTEKLGATVGRRGQRRRPRAPAPRRRAARAWTSRRSRPTARWCSATSTSTTTPRWRSAGSSARSRCSARASTPRSSGSPSTRRRTRRPQYLRGTFDWHIDGCTDDIPIMATMLSAHAVAESGGETEFASTYAAYEDLDRRREGAARGGAGGAHHRGVAAAVQQRPDRPRRWRSGGRGRRRSTRSCGRHRVRPPVARARRHHRPRRRHGPRRGPGRCSTTCSPGPTTPDRVYRHEWQVGDVVIWDNRGVLHRACPYDPTSPRDMHRTTFAGDEPIQ